MVAIVTGSGLGLFNTSRTLLGEQGVTGNAALGQGNERIYVNAATGNLVIQQTDEMLFGAGPDLNLVRTYNSQGLMTDDNGDNWRLSASTSLKNIPTGASINASGSSITRVGADGSETVYTYDANFAAYVSKDGDGAHDFIKYTSGTTPYWTFTDGSSRITENYNTAGQLTSTADIDGNTTTYTYSGTLLTQINTLTQDTSGSTTTRNQTTTIVYSGNNITQIYTVSNGLTETRTRYSYDTSNRLTQVTVDLTPGDNVISDGNTYVTTYTYDGTSKRVASITQSGGTTVAFTYETSGAFRLKTIVDGLGRTTTINYISSTQTNVVDALNQTTNYFYDASLRLTEIRTPVLTGGTYISTKYTYDADGNVATVTDGRGNVTTLQYDTNGNQTLSRDILGNTITRTFNSNNQLISETRYITPDSDGAGAALPSNPLTSNFIYDSENHLRFLISAEGRVTEYRYNTVGQRTAEIQYTAGTYTSTTFAEPNLTTWVGTQDKTKSIRTDYVYDFRGQLSTATQFNAINATTGEGITDTTNNSVTRYVYDQRGLLLKRIDPRGEVTTTIANDYTTTYTYDGLGRLLSTTDALGNVTSQQYDAAQNRIVTTAANGVLTTSVFDARGLMISTSQASGGTTLGTTTYNYDVLGRLCQVTDPTGVKTYTLYDEANRKVADIDGTGALTEYVYNANNQIWKTIRYANRLSATQQSNLLANPTTSTLSGMRPTADSTKDQITWAIYDTANRLLWSIVSIDTSQSSGYATQYTYDGANHLIQTTRYDTAVSTTGISATSSSLTAPTGTTRVIRYFYDKDDKLQGTLDALGYLTENQYSAAGQLIHTIAYAKASNSATRATDTFSSLKTNIVNQGASSDDQHQYSFYNNKGQLTGQLDAENYLTRYTYDTAGNVTQQTRYADKSIAYTGSQTLDQLTPTTTVNGANQIVVTTYTALNQIDTVTKNPEGTVTKYSYDNMGRLTRTDAAYNTTDVRTTQVKYDVYGRVIAEISGEGSAALAALVNPGQAQIDNIWSQYGISHSYDAAGRRTVTTDQYGYKTFYYYDEANRLRYTIRQADNGTTLVNSGEITEREYDVIGQHIFTRRYANRISTSGLTGGLLTSAFQTTVTALRSTLNDRVDETQYTLRGAVKAAIDALGKSTAYTYNAFGEVATLTAPARAVLTNSYNQLGQLISTTRTTTSLDINTTESRTYDAFGRIKTATDANGNITSFNYDRLGRQVSITDPLNNTRSITYDAIGRVLTQTDALNQITTYSYDDANRSVSITTPEGIKTTTVKNRTGDTVSITDGRGNVSTYSYNKDGQLKTQADALANTTMHNYDRAGREIETIDANNNRTTFVYDAAGRLLTRSVDPTGLNLKTSYEYDAIGNTIKVTDANNVITQTQYDAKGQVKAVVVDAVTGGLNLRTEYTYDDAGRTLTVTQGAGSIDARTTQYVYDALGRRTKEIVDPTGLKLTTEYLYDKNDNVTLKIEAQGTTAERITNYIYDKNDRLIMTVDPIGAVTENVYDKNGNLSKTIRYANAITLNNVVSYSNTNSYNYTSATNQINQVVGGRSIKISTANIAVGVPTTGLVYSDQNSALTSTSMTLSNGSVTNWQGELNLTVSASAVAGNYAGVIEVRGSTATTLLAMNVSLDANKNISRVLYLPKLDDIRRLLTANSSSDQTTRYVYDKNNRLSYSVDAMGAVTERTYDAAGNLIQSIAYATALTSTQLSTLDTASDKLATLTNSVVSSSTDHISRAAYDAANHQKYSIDALGNVTENVYDNVGNVVDSIRYATVIPLQDALTFSNTTGYTYNATTNTFTAGSGRSITLQAGGYKDLTPVQISADIYAQNGATVLQSLTTMALDFDMAQNWHGEVNIPTLAAGTYRVVTRVYASDSTNRTTTLNITIDASGNITRVQYAPTALEIRKLITSSATLDEHTKHVYDAANRARYEIDALGYVSENTYDKTGHVVQVTGYAAAIDTTLITTSTTPGAVQALLNTTSVDNRITHYVYDNAGRQRFVIDALGNVTDKQYDRIGNVSQTTRYAKPVTLPTGVTFNHTVAEVLNVLIGVPDATKDQINAYSYDLANRLISTTNYYNADDGTNASYSDAITYDALGNKIAYTNQKGDTWTFQYDKAGRLTQEATPYVAVTRTQGYASSTVTTTESAITKITYDVFGNVISRTEGLGKDNSTTSSPEIIATNVGNISGSAGNDSRTQVAVDSAGNAMAIWVGGSASVSGVVVSYYSASTGTWGAATSLALSGSAPQIAVDAQGNAIAVWVDLSNKVDSLYASRYSAVSGTWSTPQLLETISGTVSVPQVAMDTAGNALVVWVQGNSYSIFTKRYSIATGTWDTNFTTLSNSGGTSPQIAINAQGNAVAVWEQSGSIYSNIFSASTATWGSTAKLVEMGTSSASTPQVAMDAQGNAMAVWYQNGYLYANRYNASTGTWGTELLIETASGSVWGAQIAMDANGNAMAVWAQLDGAVYSVYANRFTLSTGTWGSAQLIETGTGTANKPQIKLDGQGNATAVWIQNDGSANSIYSNRYNATTGSWGEAQLLESGTRNADSPRIAVNTQGVVVALWLQDDGRYTNLYANRYDATTGNWNNKTFNTQNARTTYYVYDVLGRQIQTIYPSTNSDERLLSAPTNSDTKPKVVVDAQGNATAVWARESGGSSYDLYTSRYNAFTGSWSTETLLYSGASSTNGDFQIAQNAQGDIWLAFVRSGIRVMSYTAATGTWDTAQVISSNSGSSDLQIAVDAKGNAIVVWGETGSSGSIFANRFSVDTGTWATVKVLENSAYGTSSPQIAMDTQGNAIVVWLQKDGSSTGSFYSVYANRYDVISGSWGTAQLLETSTKNAQLSQVTMDAMGNAVAVWVQQDDGNSGAPYSVWANRYNVMTGTWGTAQLLETDAGNALVTTSPGNVVSPRIASDSNGNVVVVWQQTDTATNYQRIFSNRYNAVTGAWSGAQLVQSFNSTSTFVSDLQIVLDAQGNAMLVWTLDEGGAGFNIYSSRYTAAVASWGAVTLVETSTQGDAFYADISGDAQGNIVAVWIGGNFGGASKTGMIYTNRYSALTGTWGKPPSATSYNAPQTVTSHTQYDVWGNAIVNVDVGGNYTYKAYDRLGRVKYEIDGERFVTEYSYDGFDNQTAVTRYANALKNSNGTDLASMLSKEATSTLTGKVTGYSVSDIQSLLTTSANDRVLTNVYDQLNRITETRQPQVYSYDPTSVTNPYFISSPTTRNEYNAFGQVIRQRTLINTNGSTESSLWSWADTYAYYDRVGHKTADINALGFISKYEYDTSGNLTKQIEYAKALTAGGWNLQTYPNPVPATLPVDGYSTSAIGFDRETQYVYDRLNRKVQEVKKGVQYALPDTGIATPTMTVGDVKTRYAYDATGNLVSVTDNNNASTYFYYDALGRTIANVEPVRLNTSSVSLTPITVFNLDIFGNVAEQIRYANSANSVSKSGFVLPGTSTQDQHTYSLYDIYGHAIKTIDGEGSVTDVISYNVLGQVTGSLSKTFTYDRNGHQVTTYEAGATTQVQYDAFGNIVRKGVKEFDTTSPLYNGGWQEKYEYDSAGRLWRTNQNDGVTRVYLYNLQGQATAEITSQSLDLYTYSNAQTVAALNTNIVRSNTSYDSLGRVIQQTGPAYTQAPQWENAQIAESLKGKVTDAQIASDAQGNVMAVWVQNDGVNNNLYAQRYNVATATWSAAQVIETMDGNVSSPQIAVDSQGNAIAIWVQADGISNSIFVNRYSVSTGAWGVAEAIESGNGIGQAPIIAMDAQGNAAVAWIQNDGSYDNLYCRRFNATNLTWGAAQLLDNTSWPVASSDIAIDTLGNVMVVWVQSSLLYSNRYNAGTGQWDTAPQIVGDASSGGGAVNIPQVAMDSLGNAVVVWIRNGKIYTNRYNISTGTWGTAKLIESFSGTGYSPQIAVDAQGNAIVLWVQNYDLYVNRYNVSSDTWGTTPELIESGSGYVSGFDGGGGALGAMISSPPRIVMDVSGNATAVWVQNDGTTNSIYTNRYVKSTGTWGTAKLIESGVDSADSSQVTVDSLGNEMVVWIQRNSLYASRYTATSGLWSTEQLVTPGVNAVPAPITASDAQGNTLAVWVQNDGTTDSLYAKRYNINTQTWSAAQLIETGSGAVQTPQIVMDNAGNALVVWSQQDGAVTSIYANRYNVTSNTWGTAQLLETGTTAVTSPLISINASGNAMAVWMQNGSVYANRFDASSGTWLGAQLTTLGGVSQISMDANGNVMAVWVQSDGVANSIYASRYNASNGIWSASQLLETSSGAALTPQICFDSAGNAIAVWSQSNGTSYSIYTNRYTNNAWGAAQQLSSTAVPFGSAFTPRIAMDTNGNAMVMWVQWWGSNVNLYASRYSATTKVFSVPTLLEYDAKDVINSNISFDANGNAMAIWIQDNNVYTNRYNVATNTWGNAQRICASTNYASPKITFDAQGNALAVWAQSSSTGASNVYFSRLNTTTYVVSPVTTQTFDRWGNVIAVTDPRNASWVTTTRYNALNQVIQQTKPVVTVLDEHGVSSNQTPTTTYYYDALGRQIAVKDANQHINAKQYDAAGQVIAEIHADGYTTQYTYDALGRKVAMIDARNNKTTYVYNRNDLLTSQTNALNETTSYAYDSLGRRIRVTDALNNVTQYSYDGRGNITKTILPGLQETIAQYDLLGHKIKEYQTGNTDFTAWTYNYFGQLTGHTDVGGATYSYSYNKSGQLTLQTNSRGQNLSYTYYANGQQEYIYDNGAASGSLTATHTTTWYQYDMAGNRIHEMYWNSYGAGVYQDAYISYDSLGRMTRYDDKAVVVEYSYDAVGNRRHTNANASVNGIYDYWYTYDAMNRLTTSKGKLNTLTHQIEISSNGVLLQYDQVGNRKSATHWTGYSENYDYDAAGRLSRTYIGSSTINERTYDAAGRVKTYIVYSAGAIKSKQVNEYDVNGWLLKQINSNDAGTVTSTVDYTVWAVDVYGVAYSTGVGNYTSDGRLLGYKLIVPSVNGSQAYTNTYTTSYIKLEGYKEDVINATSSYFSPGSTAYRYDINGNLVQFTDSTKSTNNRSFINNAQGQILKKFTSTGGNAGTYYYANGKAIGSATDFDYNFTPISANYPANTPSQYTANAGDTVQTAALAVYGDEALWYLIADANGLDFDTVLTEGQILKVPNTVSNIHNTSNTFKPYNPGQIIGDTTPNLPDPPPPPPPRHGCGLKQLIVIVVAVAVTFMTGGVMGAMLGSIASQLTGMALGIQDKFSWKQVGVAGLSAWATAGFSGGEGWQAVQNAAASNVINQGINIAFGMQDKFSWSQMAASAIAAPINSKINSKLSGNAAAAGSALGDFSNNANGGASWSGFGNDLLANVGTGFVNQAAKIAVTGDGQIDWSGVAINAIGQSVGSAINAGLQGAAKSAYDRNLERANSASSFSFKPIDLSMNVSPDELRDALSMNGSTDVSAPAKHVAQSGENISTILGTSDPVAIGAFMRLNGLSNSTIYAGREYVLPNGSVDGDGALGQGALNADNARLAELSARQQQDDYDFITDKDVDYYMGRINNPRVIVDPVVQEQTKPGILSRLPGSFGKEYATFFAGEGAERFTNGVINLGEAVVKSSTKLLPIVGEAASYTASVSLEKLKQGSNFDLNVEMKTQADMWVKGKFYGLGGSGIAVAAVGVAALFTPIGWAAVPTAAIAGFAAGDFAGSVYMDASGYEDFVREGYRIRANSTQ